jgi:uncharacterized protein with gpF-like domain
MADPRMDMERTFAAKVFDALKTWLAKVRTAVMGPWNKHKSKPSAIEVHTAQPLWLRLVAALEADLKPHAQQGINEVPGAKVDAQDQFIQNQLAVIHRLLVRIPDEVQNLIQNEINQAVNDGASLEQIAARVDALLDATGSQRWKNRAQVIAVTSTHQLANAGIQAAGSALQRQEGTQLMKTWTSKKDSLVRKDHADANGQTVPMNSFFKVGGSPMLFPGDPTAPADQVINCRCIPKITEKSS